MAGGRVQEIVPEMARECGDPAIGAFERSPEERVNAKSLTPYETERAGKIHGIPFAKQIVGRLGRGSNIPDETKERPLVEMNRRRRVEAGTYVPFQDHRDSSFVEGQRQIAMLARRQALVEASDAFKDSAWGKKDVRLGRIY